MRFCRALIQGRRRLLRLRRPCSSIHLICLPEQLGASKRDEWRRESPDVHSAINQLNDQHLDECIRTARQPFRVGAIGTGDILKAGAIKDGSVENRISEINPD